MIGEVVGSYKILRLLGQGGMGVVYEAEHQMLGSRAVIKLLKPERCGNEAVLERFFNEAKAASKIRHAGIVQVFDFGVHDGNSAYIVMELLEGENLHDRLARGRLDPRAAAVIARQVASALNAAHKNGIIHRDLKPDNLFLVTDPDVLEGERVKVLDFGIAKLASANSRTVSGDVFGTPFYMAPEQCRSAAEAEPRSDVYALGCILYEMICGRPPFVGETIAELVTAHLFTAPRPPSELVDIPAALEKTLMRALAKKPEERHASMSAFSADLDAFTGHRALTPLPFTAVSIPRVAIPAGKGLSTTLGHSTGQLLLKQRRTRVLRRLAIATLAVATIAGVMLLSRSWTDEREAASVTPAVAPPDAAHSNDDDDASIIQEVILETQSDAAVALPQTKRPQRSATQRPKPEPTKPETTKPEPTKQGQDNGRPRVRFDRGD